MKKGSILSALLLFYFAMGALTIFAYGRNLADTVSVSAEKKTRVFVIDAGHGGEDGGALSPQGDKESEFNLDIAEKIQLIFAFLGQKTVMTRESEQISYPESLRSVRERKRWDLQTRTDLINSTENGVLVSIHQNMYPSPEPFGAQVLYNTAAELMGKKLQQDIIDNIDGANYREAEEASSDIYMMKNSKRPSVLIECCFLSNENDLIRLKTDEYRLKFSCVTVCSILDYYMSEQFA